MRRFDLDEVDTPPGLGKDPLYVAPSESHCSDCQMYHSGECF